MKFLIAGRKKTGMIIIPVEKIFACKVGNERVLITLTNGGEIVIGEAKQREDVLIFLQKSNFVSQSNIYFNPSGFSSIYAKDGSVIAVCGNWKFGLAPETLEAIIAANKIRGTE